MQNTCAQLLVRFLIGTAVEFGNRCASDIGNISNRKRSSSDKIASGARIKRANWSLGGWSRCYRNSSSQFVTNAATAAQLRIDRNYSTCWSDKFGNADCWCSYFTANSTARTDQPDLPMPIEPFVLGCI